MTDITVTLGGITFQGYEVPEAIPFGGAQMLSVKKLIGGKRVIDAMGADDRPLTWSGRFRGPSAIARARAVDALRKAGKPVTLTWGEMAFTVTIADFRPVYEKAYECPYDITCEVVSDDAHPGGAGSVIGVDDMVSADQAQALALGDRIADAPLSGLLTTLDGAISSVSSFATATTSTLNSILDPISAVQGRVLTLIGQSEAVFENVVTVGGVLPDNPVSRMASGLVAQASAMGRLADLYDLQSVTGRMATNLSAVGSSGAEVVTAGGDLYGLAERAYGDAAEWATIARANGLTDPMLTGVQTILIPPTSGRTAGVL